MTTILAKPQVSVEAPATPVVGQRSLSEAPLRLLYSGFDTLDIVFKGRLSDEGIATLEIARAMALDRNGEPVLAVLGPANEPVHVHPNGLPGGYRLRCTNGSVGEIWGFTDAQPQDWNIFCSVRAAALAAHGWHETVRRIFARLDAFGCRICDHRVNRVDYAMDFLMPPTFELSLDRFVTHPRMQKKPHWGRRQPEHDPGPSAICRGRKLESVTVGKMPRKQLCAYDKRREALDQGKPIWFRIWRIDPGDRSANVIRVELRAKKELRNRWGIQTIQDVQASIADVFLAMVEEVRYRAPDQSDSNVWRQRLHPLWLAVVQHLEGSLLAFRSGLLPSDIKELERQVAQERYRTMVLGNLAGYAVACGLDDASMERNLPEIARSLTVRALRDPERRFARSVDRARERLRFVAGEPPPAAE